MPESQVRKSAADKKRSSRAGSEPTNRQLKKAEAPDSRAWVPPTFITVGLLGVAWIVVYYVTASTGITVPVITPLEGWNLLIGMVAMAAAFALAILWK